MTDGFPAVEGAVTMGNRPDHHDQIPQPIAALAQLGNVQRFPAKAGLIREGEPGSTLFVLLEGRIRIFTEDSEGRRFVFGTYGIGTVFGEGALDGGPRTASVEALDDCACAIVPYADMLKRMGRDPAFAMTLLTELIARSRASTMRIKSLALDSVYQRLRAFIDEEATVVDDVRHLGSDWSQQEIANRLGSSRDMVTKIFRELAKGGYIECHRGETRILKTLPKAW
jgi:CRP/FNR family cyclic AMP-dependent transcriptional regulator